MESYYDQEMNRELSSGETEALEAEQKQFNQWMQVDIEGDYFWEFSDTFYDDKNLQDNFFNFIGEHIKSTPAYVFVLRYLMLCYNISIGEANMRGLWKHIKDEKWTVDDGVDPGRLWPKLQRKNGEEPEKFEEEDYRLLLSVICANLKQEYPEELQRKNRPWTRYFYDLINDFNSKRLKELALALNMDLMLYQQFKAKVLRTRRLNFLDHDEVVMYLTLKYAAECGISHYDAYNSLNKIYPLERMERKKARQGLADIDDDARSSEAICKETLGFLEEKGRLKESFKRVLFKEIDEDLSEYFHKIDILAGARISRSAQKVFLEQWEKFYEDVRKYYHREINEFNRNRDGHKDGMYNLDRHKVFRWLYGKNVEYQTQDARGVNHINDRRDEDMPMLGGGIADFYLDSKEFLDTRMRDNDFYATTFTRNEVRQRNLLLTIGFLNYVLPWSEVAWDNNGLAYQDKVWYFDAEMKGILESCGFGPLYSGNAYDAFLKLLLSSDDPLGLFQYIWRKKTDSEE